MAFPIEHRDPVCGMSGVLKRHGQWFCSDACAAVYAAQREQAEGRRGRARWRDPWLWVPISGMLIATLGLWWRAGAAVSEVYLRYFAKIMLPFLIGLVIGGFIDHFIPKTYIIKLLTGHRKRVIARATLLGFIASTCSHGCLALAIELYRKGASIPAVVSFLLASPWASMPLTFIILSLFGLRGLLIVFGALAIAWVTGYAFQQLAKRHYIEGNPHTSTVEADFSIRRDFGTRWRAYRWTRSQLIADAQGVLRGMVPLGRMVLGWVQLGLILSALLGAFVPHDLVAQFFGPTLGGLGLTLVAATVIEVCSEGTAPLAFELYQKSGAFGNAFVFLMAGVITDYTELAALWANVGRRTVFWLLAVTIPPTVGLGWVLNLR